MKRLVVLFFIAIFALAASAKDFPPNATFVDHRPKLPTISVDPTVSFAKPPKPTITVDPTVISVVPAKSSPSVNATNSKPHKTVTASAQPTPTEGRNGQFHQVSRDGKPSAKVCDISNLPIANGTQNKTPGVITCSTTQQGEIPDVHHMVSTVILTPKNGATIPANKLFTVSARSANLNLGFFDDPEQHYYLSSQQLDKKGFIMGHQHVTIQKIVDPKKPMDPTQHVFFKGLNAASTNNGVLSVDVTDGLPNGHYRLCTLSASFGHQPLLMPVAQRGAQDDCIRFFVK